VRERRDEFVLAAVRLAEGFLARLARADVNAAADLSIVGQPDVRPGSLDLASIPRVHADVIHPSRHDSMNSATFRR